MPRSAGKTPRTLERALERGRSYASRASRFAGGFGALLVLALLALTGGGRVVHAPPAPMAAAITFLPYLYAAAIAILFAAWALFRDRVLLPVCVVSLVVLAAALWGPRWQGDAAIVEGDDVRVMSWNLRRLWGGPDDGGDPDRCAIDAIDTIAPDVLTLLEVSQDDVGRLSTALHLDCVHHPYLKDGGPKTGGLAACIRGDRWHLRSGKGLRFVDQSDWYYVFAEIEHGEDVFNLLSVHLSPYEYVAKKIRTSVEGIGRGDPGKLVDLSREGEEIVKGQADQSAALLERVDKLRDPTVVAGDFNSTRDSALHASLRSKLADTWEVGGAGFGGTVQLFDRLPLRIDYVYATDQFRVRRAEVPELGCSDHRPVVSDLVLTK
jgi:endonuclease/exonuclease/phosphatase family metal-dependent hydrolase